MAMFCMKCGAQLPDGTVFCPACGADQRTAPAFAGNGAVREGIPAPGFSDRVNHPEILAAVKKNCRASGIFGLFLVPLPLIGFIVYGAVSGKMELPQAATYGGIVSAIFLLFALYGLIKGRAERAYEAVVIDKKTGTAYRRSNGDSSERYTVYTTVVRTNEGKKKKITEREGSRIVAFQYLNVGDRFRYYPQFAFPYELFDKSRAPYLGCAGCGTQNPKEADRCRKCGLPLLK